MNACKEYKDKHGNIIKEFDTIRHDDGDSEVVYACGDNDLGVQATNPEFLKHHPEADIEYYPLSEFDLSEWEIVEPLSSI